ncbi:OLC1v1023316C1 [Oldenlandia corymbosa var. corymbosa]|uniref:OLC1v1023316C1 n=1 Tax=Oldenlandia corymbosa var. corymbosa TaxID=529605 RepID=A0AAV1C1C6_OLDCO|nr:OLC1v1023316C1 [Oldenlandia corymbosa var. corymbosa]
MKPRSKSPKWVWRKIDKQPEEARRLTPFSSDSGVEEVFNVSTVALADATVSSKLVDGNSAKAATIPPHDVSNDHILSNLRKTSPVVGSIPNLPTQQLGLITKSPLQEQLGPRKHNIKSYPRHYSVVRKGTKIQTLSTKRRLSVFTVHRWKGFRSMNGDRLFRRISFLRSTLDIHYLPGKRYLPRTMALMPIHKRARASPLIWRKPGIALPSPGSCLQKWLESSEFSSMEVIPPRLTAGGLAIAWSSTVQLEVVVTSQSFVCCKIVECNGLVWLLVCMYGPPNAVNRSSVWQQLNDTISALDYLILFAGDFNQILSPNDKCEGRPFQSPQASSLRKIAGFRTDSLSVIGRVVLARHVLSSLPQYAMGIFNLPVAVTKSIDKLLAHLFGTGTKTVTKYTGEPGQLSANPVFMEHDQGGVNMVKSAYHQACALKDAAMNTLSTSNGPVIVPTAVWKKLWTSALPDHIKFFIWHGLSDTCPMMQALAHRGLTVAPLCLRCDHNWEILDDAEELSLPQIVQQAVRKSQLYRPIKSLPPPILDECEEIPCCLETIPTLRFDGAFNPQSHSASAGWTFSPSNGHVLVRGGTTFFAFSALQAEALACLHALEVVDSSAFQDIFLCTDCLTLAQLLQRQTSAPRELQQLEEMIGGPLLSGSKETEQTDLELTAEEETVEEMGERKNRGAMVTVYPKAAAEEEDNQLSEFLIPTHNQPSKRTGTIWTATAHIITGVVGAGVLSLAWSTAQLGWVAGPLAILVLAGISLFSTFLLCDCYMSPHPEFGPFRLTSFTGAVNFYLGERMGRICKMVMLETLYGTGVAYTITATKSVRAIQKSNCYHREGHSANCGHDDSKFMLIFGAVQILMSQIPDFHNMAWLSIIAAAMSFSYSFIGLGLGLAKIIENGKILGSITGIPSTSTANKLWLVFQALGDIAFAYPYSIILLEIQDTLKSPPSENKTMKKSSTASIIITTFFYMCCGCFGYAAFGDQTPGNLLNGFGFYEPYWLVDFANACIILHLVGGYQVYSQPMFALVEKWFNSKYPNSSYARNLVLKLPMLAGFELNILRLWFRSAYVLSITGISMLFPYFNQVLGLLGALNFWCLAVYFPLQMFIVQRKIDSWTRKWILLKIFSFVLLAISVMSLIGSVKGLINAKFG